MVEKCFTEKKRIGIIGLSPGTGAGFIASNLGRTLAKEKDGTCPAVVELGQGSLFDALGMGRRFAGKEYFDFQGAVSQGKSLRGRKNQCWGVNWVLRSHEDTNLRLEDEHRFRLISNVPGDPVFCRFSGVPEEKLGDLIPEMDALLVAIDPLPSRLIPAHGLLCRLRRAEIPVLYVINKWNEGVDKGELFNYLQLREAIRIPEIPARYIYGAEYACRPAVDIPSAEEYLKEPLRQILQRLELL